MIVIAIPAKPAPTPAAPTMPADPLVTYYRNVRQMNIQLAKDRYKQGFKVRTQEYIRGRGTLAIVDEDICMAVRTVSTTVPSNQSAW
jgi:hypothetical protein